MSVFSDMQVGGSHESSFRCWWSCADRRTRVNPMNPQYLGVSLMFWASVCCWGRMFINSGTFSLSVLCTHACFSLPLIFPRSILTPPGKSVGSSFDFFQQSNYNNYTCGNHFFWFGTLGNKEQQLPAVIHYSLQSCDMTELFFNIYIITSR